MGKASRIVELYENKDQTLNAAVDRIVVEIFNRKSDESGQKILLTGCSPLAGTTSISIALGIAIAATGRRAVLVDCDLRKFIKYKKLNEVTENGLSNYLLNERNTQFSEDEIVYRTNIRGLEYIPGGYSQGNPTRVLCSEKFPTLIKSLASQYDCVIFDLPSLAVVPDAQVLFPYVDGIALVSALSETKKRHVKEAKRLVAPFSDRYYGMIINKVPTDMYKKTNKEYEYYLTDKSGNQILGGNKIKRKFDKSKETTEK